MYTWEIAVALTCTMKQHDKMTLNSQTKAQQHWLTPQAHPCNNMLILSPSLHFLISHPTISIQNYYPPSPPLPHAPPILCPPQPLPSTNLFIQLLFQCNFSKDIIFSSVMLGLYLLLSSHNSPVCGEWGGAGRRRLICTLVHCVCNHQSAHKTQVKHLFRVLLNYWDWFCLLKHPITHTHTYSTYNERTHKSEMVRWKCEMEMKIWNREM